jgi:hypothetical protein
MANEGNWIEIDQNRAREVCVKILDDAAASIRATRRAEG